MRKLFKIVTGECCPGIQLDQEEGDDSVFLILNAKAWLRLVRTIVFRYISHSFTLIRWNINTENWFYELIWLMEGRELDPGLLSFIFPLMTDYETSNFFQTQFGNYTITFGNMVGELPDHLIALGPRRVKLSLVILKVWPSSIKLIGQANSISKCLGWGLAVYILLITTVVKTIKFCESLLGHWFRCLYFSDQLYFWVPREADTKIRLNL